jgi:CRP-like cAMP-binding protein
VELNEVPVSVITEGAFFGETSAVLEAGSEATFRALSHVELFRLHHEDFKDLLEYNPRTALVSKKT